jgi:hypothetical protein
MEPREALELSFTEIPAPAIAPRNRQIRHYKKQQGGEGGERQAAGAESSVRIATPWMHERKRNILRQQHSGEGRNLRGNAAQELVRARPRDNLRTAPGRER